jgi:transcriptional regulator with XRE-family HTH domain
MTKRLLKQIRTAMRERDVIQETVAEACGVSQGHLSKVLRGKEVLTKKMAVKLNCWLAGEGTPISTEALSGAIQQLLRTRPDRHMQVMQLLQLVEQILN